MAPKKRKQKNRKEQESPRQERVVAVHDDVKELLTDWSKDKNHKSVATKIHNLIKAYGNDEKSTVDAIKRQLAVDPIHGCQGLVELGPKQSKGGAARIFLLDKYCIAFFVAGGVEKGSTGVNIDEARKRANELKKLFKGNDRDSALNVLKTEIGTYYLLT